MVQEREVTQFMSPSFKLTLKNGSTIEAVPSPSTVRSKRSKDVSVYDRHCSICGKAFDLLDAQENFGFDYHVGYGTRHDGEHLQVHLCCACFDRILDEFILPLCTEQIIEDEMI